MVHNNQGNRIIRDEHFDHKANTMVRRVTYRMADFNPHFGVPTQETDAKS